jgi:hypothetical protein
MSQLPARREDEDASLGAPSQHTAKLAKWWRARGPKNEGPL